MPSAATNLQNLPSAATKTSRRRQMSSKPQSILGNSTGRHHFGIFLFFLQLVGFKLFKAGKTAQTSSVMLQELVADIRDKYIWQITAKTVILVQMVLPAKPVMKVCQKLLLPPVLQAELVSIVF